MDTNMTITIPTIKSNRELIDIHSHILYDVDDGSKTLEQSIETLVEAKKALVTKIVCTPHIQYASLEKRSKVKENFEILKEYAKKFEIELLLGNEVLLSSETETLLKENKIETINKTKYLLVEFKRTESRNIYDLLNQLEDLMDLGYLVVLAHPELYRNYQKIEYMKKFKEIGVFLQLDATSILRGKTDKKTYKFSKKLIKSHLIDLIASDSHSNKKRNYKTFKKAYKKVKWKYGNRISYKLFVENPFYLINGGII